MGPNDAGVTKAIVVAMQAASEPRLLVWDFIVRLLL